jgi:hypothetical protein
VTPIEVHGSIAKSSLLAKKRQPLLKQWCEDRWCGRAWRRSGVDLPQIAKDMWRGASGRGNMHGILTTGDANRRALDELPHVPIREPPDIRESVG